MSASAKAVNDVVVTEVVSGADVVTKPTQARGTWLLLFGTLVALQLVAWRTPAAYLGFQPTAFRLENGVTTTVPAGGAKLPATEGAVFVQFSDDTGTVGPIRSAPFVARGEMLELECAGDMRVDSKGGVRIHLLPVAAGPDANSAGIGELPYSRLPLLEPLLKEHEWTPYRVPIPVSMYNRQVMLEIELTDGVQRHNGWFGVRNKVAGIGPEPLGTQLVESGMLIWVVTPLALVAAAFLMNLLRRGAVARLSTAGLFLLLLALGALAHYRPETFFYFDEYHVFGRFQTMGLGAALLSHNEHFIPGFLTFYYAEARLFGASPTPYLCVTFFFHTLNALLLFQLLLRLLRTHERARSIATLLAMLFVVHSVYAETQQWIFEQAVLISETLVLSALLLGWDYLARGGALRLLGIAVACGAAPLFFGNGFAVLPVLAGIAALSFVGPDTEPLASVRSRAIRSGVVLAVALGVLGGAGALYAAHKESAGNGVQQARPFAEPSRLASYVFTGAELGTVLRGVGLFPAIDLDAPMLAGKRLGWNHPRLPAELLGAVAGLVVSLVALLIGLLGDRPRRWVVGCWLCGQWVIVSSVVLPSLGRWQLGDAQSLASRYHYATLVGLAILLLPAASTAAQWFADPRRTLTRSALVALGLLFVAEQLVAGRLYSYFSDQHVRDRNFIEQLRDWNMQLRTVATDSPVPYEGTGTPLAGLYPMNLESITPGRHPDQVYAVMNWLDPQFYPERAR